MIFTRFVLFRDSTCVYAQSMGISRPFKINSLIQKLVLN